LLTSLLFCVISAETAALPSFTATGAALERISSATLSSSAQAARSSVVTETIGAADVVTKDTTVYVTDVANTGSTSTNNTTTIGANNVSVTTDDLAACVC